MRREVVLSESALTDLLDINDYLWEISDRIASKIIDSLESAVKIIQKGTFQRFFGEMRVAIFINSVCFLGIDDCIHKDTCGFS